MKISSEVVEIVNNSISGFSSETGGILGSRNQDVIDEVVMDLQNERSESRCTYSPNVDYLNRQIVSWQERGIDFKGMFHTHFAGVRTLSDSDKDYIERIMMAMPLQITTLYFPVFVLPDREFVCYKAERLNGKIVIYAS